MLSAFTMVMAAALSGVGQVELVEFTADWCGACQQMQPVISRLQADGFSVRQLDFEQHRGTAERAGVRALPTLILLVDGQEVQRFTGQQTYDQLRAALAQTAAGPPAPPPESRTTAPAARSPHNHPSDPIDSIVRGQSPTAGRPITASIQQAMQATVRIRIDDPQGRAIGTGTIVDTHKDEALVLTCGHIFRDSNGTGAIECDVFSNGQLSTVPGRMISWNIRRDVGLISIKPGVPIRPMRVAGPGHQPRPGDRVFSVGCNRGNAPSVMENRVIAVNRYHGPANLVVGGRPVDGRSGGGLFTSDGMLIGVCNAADQEEDEGLYAAIPPIHAELGSAGLGFVYRPDEKPIASVSSPSSIPVVENAPPLVSRETSSDGQVEAPHSGPFPARLETPLGMRAELNDATQVPLGIDIAQLQRDARDSEVICILRDRDTPAARSRVYVLEQPSPQFLSQLSTEISKRGPLASTGLRVDSPQQQPPHTARDAGGWQHARPEFVR